MEDNKGILDVIKRTATAKVVKKDCFAYVTKKYRDGIVTEKCSALKELDCETCKFYKPKGTQCDTCSHKGKKSCKNCWPKEFMGN